MTRHHLATALALIAASATAAPPPPDSPDGLIMRDFRDWIVEQHAEDGQWCCDLGDGRPLNDTEIRVEGGQYQILYSRAHWQDGTDRWIDVPPGAVLRRLSPVGYVIAWVIAGRVFCLCLQGAA